MIARLTRSLAVRLALTLAVTAVLVARIDLRAAAAALLRLDPWAALAVLALLALDRAAMVWRWIVLLVSTGAAVSRKSMRTTTSKPANGLILGRDGVIPDWDSI